MTTHTDLIARLRSYDAEVKVTPEEAADALESLEKQVVALVDERAKSAEQYVARLNQIDALTKELENMTGANMLNANALRLIKEKLAAAQAREAKLREAALELPPIVRGRNLNEALALPADDSALMERLKDERERCAKVCDEFQKTSYLSVGTTLARMIRELP